MPGEMKLLGLARKDLFKANNLLFMKEDAEKCFYFYWFVLFDIKKIKKINFF